MHRIKHITDCSQDQGTMLAAFIRDKADAIISQWSAISCADFDETAIVQLQSEVKALLHAVAEHLHADEARRNQPAGGAASLIVSAERYAIHHLTNGHTEVQLVLTLQALRKVVLQTWTGSLTVCGMQTLDAVNRVNLAFDNILSAALDHFCHVRNQCHGLFLKTLAHDLRNPLGGLELTAQMMMQNSVHAVDAMHRIASNISRSVDNAVKVAGDMYDLGNMRGGLGIVVNPIMIDVASLCRKLADHTASRFSEQSIKLELIGVETAEAPKGLVDERRVIQALQNLIGYAARHTVKHRPPEASLQVSSEELIFTVRYFSDVPATDDLESLFIPMRRYATHLLAKKGPLSELGIDLYIAREIIHAHEGDLKVYTTEGWVTFEARLRLDGCTIQ